MEGVHRRNRGEQALQGRLLLRPQLPSRLGEQTLSLRRGTPPSSSPDVHPFHAGIWMKDFGFECSEPLVVTEKGCELFLNFERKLFSK
jgi:Xaa-Pro dipeptidase